MIFNLILLLAFPSFLESVDIPIQIHVLFRHGERSPTSTFPNDPHKNYNWEGGLGQLTNRGKLQMYSLGQHLRNYYSDFLPKYYWPADVNVSSSPVERCLVSAQFVSAGLFPPHDGLIWNPDLLWQPIPTHYLPRDQDNLLAMKSNCTEYDKEFAGVQNSTKMQQYNEKYQELYKFLTDHTGRTVNNIEHVESLYNTLEIYQMNNMSLPYWVNDTLMAQMRIIGAQNLAIYSETDYMKRMKGGFFVKTVLDLMENALNSSEKVPSTNIYAAHDLTIVHVMRALGLVDTFKPELGAALIFEYYKSGEIKILYWESWEGEIEERILENCKVPCTIPLFQSGYKDVLPVNWSKECLTKT
ncbi:testicular acid phosphatase homolog isoform X1 [Dendroctonus ponderosae]